MELVDEIIAALKKASVPANLAGMKRFGIDVTHALGIPIPVLRTIAKKYKKNHSLALSLWETGVHEARILASMIDDPEEVTTSQINAWLKDFNSWDICDQVCGNLFDKTRFAIAKAKEFSRSRQEFIKRAAFSLMAEYTAHNKIAGNEIFLSFLPIIEREAWDDRNFVKKAVNWALRVIGKRNKELHTEALKTAYRVLQQDSRSAKWIAKNAIQELEGEAVKRKLGI